MAWTEITRVRYERQSGRYASDVTDQEWALIASLLPPLKTTGRPRSTAMRASGRQTQPRRRTRKDRGRADVERVQYRGRWRSVDVLACPVTWRGPHPDQIAGAQQAYEDWWQALKWVHEGLVAGGMLREKVVSEVMPKRRPWR